MDVFDRIKEEVARQDEAWGFQDYVPDDRWIEIAMDEFNDLKWAVRVPIVVKEKHDVEHELVQTISTLTRWLRAKV